MVTKYPFRSASLVAVLGLVMGLSVSSCADQGSPSSVGNSTNAENETSIEIDNFAMNVVVSGVPFWEDAKNTWEAIDLSEPDVQLTYGGPLDTNAQTQIDQILALNADDLDGLILAPADSVALNSTIDSLTEKGIPVVTLLVDAPESDRIAYVTSELEETSRRLAAEVLDEDPEGQKAIIIFAESGNQEQETRASGFREYLESRGVEIVAMIEDGYNEASGAEAVKAVLTREQNVRYIFGTHSRSAIGAVTALREVGTEKGLVAVTGWDTDEDVLNLIADGWVEVTAAQNSAYMVQTAFQIIDAYAGNYVYPANRRFQEQGVRVIPEVISIPATLVDQGNVEAYYPR